MKIESPAYTNGEPIPTKYTCQGEGVSPPLTISDVPNDAVALALIMEDPDVPRSIQPDGMWDHWIVWNINAAIQAVPEGTEPDGIQGATTDGSHGYYPPCPPDKEHRYIIKLFAIDTTLDLPAGASKAELVKAMEGHVTDRAELLGTYQQT